MKIYKIIATAVVLALLITLGVGISGCKNVATGGTASATKGTIYYMGTEMVNGFNIGSAKFFEQFGKEQGYDPKVLDANNKSDTQLTQMDTAISQKPVAIILKAVDKATVAVSIDKAQKAGIKVLAYDNTIEDAKCNFTSVLGTEKAGEIIANECVKALKQKYGSEKGKVLEVMGDLGDMWAVLCNEGFSKIIKQYPNINLIVKDSPGWAGQQNIVADQLVANKDIDVIFQMADSTIPQIIPVLEAKGLKPGDIFLIGSDGDPSALDLIRSGWLQETCVIPMISQMWGEFQFLDSVIAGKEIKAGTYDIKGVKGEVIIEKWGPTLYLPGVVVDKSNVNDPNLWGNVKLK